MNEERKVLGILAIIFGAIALFGSWMPIINNLSFVIAILALILGLIGLAINRKRPKMLAIIGTVLAVVSMVIVIATQLMYARALNDAAVSSVSSSIESSQKEEDAKFNWTKEQFDALQMGDITNYGAGGTNYDDIVSVHGEPNSINTTTVNDHESRTISYSSAGTKLRSITLTFSKQENGAYLLTAKVGIGLE